MRCEVDAVGGERNKQGARQEELCAASRLHANLNKHLLPKANSATLPLATAPAVVPQRWGYRGCRIYGSPMVGTQARAIKGSLFLSLYVGPNIALLSVCACLQGYQRFPLS